MRQKLIRDYDPAPGVSIASLEYNYPSTYVIPEHAHGADQLIYAVSGVMHVSAGATLWLIPPQFAVWIPAEMPHSIRMPAPVSMRTLYVRRRVVRMSAHVLPVRPLLREAILEAVRMENLRAGNRVHAALRTLIVSEIQNASPVPTSIALPADSRARQIASRILAYPATRESLADLCKPAGASVRTMQRVFQHDVGSDFDTWRRQARFMKAVELLVAGASVKQASADLGYSQVAPFIAMFRKVLGVTPGAWIQQLRAARSYQMAGG